VPGRPVGHVRGRVNLQPGRDRPRTKSFSSSSRYADTLYTHRRRRRRENENDNNSAVV